jgi:putative hydrolase of the HAD superfamily
VPAFRAVLFDFFGTLTRSVRRGPQHAVIARKLGCDPEMVRTVLDRTFYSRARGAFGSAESTLRWVTEQAGGRPCRSLVQAAVPARVHALRADTVLRPDAVHTLNAIKARGLRTGVISDCTHELPALLPSLPVAPLLDARVFSVELGVCKPDPAIYLAACDQLAVDPEDCLYVGDGGSRELTGATAVGMTAVRLNAPDLVDHLVFDQDASFTGSRVTSLTDILPLLDRVPVLARTSRPQPSRGCEDGPRDRTAGRGGHQEGGRRLGVRWRRPGAGAVVPAA